jgi:hypothetical protein
MPHNYTKQEVAGVLDDFLNGGGGPYDFDDFCTFTIADPELDKIRERCAGLGEEFPPEKPGQYCGSEGMDVMRGYISYLRQQPREEDAQLMAPIKEPIIVVCDEVLVFETLSHATTYIEPWDAEDCPAAYDSEGRLLRVFQSSKLEEQEPPAKRQIPFWMPAIVRPYAERYLDRQQRLARKELAAFKMTKIEAQEREPTHEGELRTVLIDWLARVYRSLYEHREIKALVLKEELAREPLERLVTRVLEPSVRRYLTK